MTTLTTEIPENVEKALAELLKQWGGKIITTDKKINSNEKKLSQKEKEFLKGFDEAVEFVNQHQQGKVKAKTIDQFLNEL
jgi:cysteine synthase